MMSAAASDASGFTSAVALDAAYGSGAAARVQSARVLVVGAGGVGCELVKNLACTGVGFIVMIDLDVIDVSNLNRQFLFRREHVGKPKAVEAAAAVARMVPGTNVEGIVGNVRETRFDVEFFRGFQLVCNALDNLEARRHVNRMCLAAGVPLIESGSTGFNGNVSVIGKGVECYDCIEKMPQKTYAVCTIRSTPDKPVHCVVWAKFLFNLIFGPDDEGNVLKDLDGVSPDGIRSENIASGDAAKTEHAAAAARSLENGGECLAVAELNNVHVSDDSAAGMKHANFSKGGGGAVGNAKINTAPGAGGPDAATVMAGHRSGDAKYDAAGPKDLRVGDDDESILNEKTKRGSIIPEAMQIHSIRDSNVPETTNENQKDLRDSAKMGMVAKTVEPNPAAAAKGRHTGDADYVVVEPNNVNMNDDGEEMVRTGLTERDPAPASKGRHENGAEHEVSELNDAHVDKNIEAAEKATGESVPDTGAATKELHSDGSDNVAKSKDTESKGGGAESKTPPRASDPNVSGASKGLSNKDVTHKIVESRILKTESDGKSEKPFRSEIVEKSDSERGTTDAGIEEPDAAAAALGRLRGDREDMVVEPTNENMNDDGEQMTKILSSKTLDSSLLSSRQIQTGSKPAFWDAQVSKSGVYGRALSNAAAIKPGAASTAEGRDIDVKEKYSVVERDSVKMIDDGNFKKQSAKRVRYADGENEDSFATRVCHRVFVEDIRYQVAMKDLWSERPPPTVYDVNAATKDTVEDLDKLDLLDQGVWSREKSASVFKGSMQRIIKTRRNEVGNLTFDKDDRDALMFVAAASNLRAHAYGVPLQAPFVVKGIAGNIVHAVATTNAVVGGLVVLEALKVISNQGDLKDSKISYVCKEAMGSRVRKLINPTPLRAPNPKCYVCSSGQLHLSIDVTHSTLRTLVESVLKAKLGVLQPTIEVSTGDFHNTLYECGAGLEEDEAAEYAANLERTLALLRVQAGSQLVINDFAQNFSFTLHVSDAGNRFDDRAPNERFEVGGNLPTAGDKPEVQDDVNDVDDDELEEVPITSGSPGDVQKMLEKQTNGGVTGQKRSLVENAVVLDEAPASKKLRSNSTMH